MNMADSPSHFRRASAGFDQPVSQNGYVWWYVDALSDDGAHGITIIAFIGSVFSPYYTWARRTKPADPLNHCSLNVALYGRPSRWAMTERRKAHVRRDATSLSIGPSNLSWDGNVLTISIDEITSPIPSRLRGTVRVTPAAVTDKTFVLNEEGNHRWWPIAPSSRVDVAMTNPALHWQGTGYLDTNMGDGPLEAGFTDWEWSRAPMRDGTAIHYEAEKRGGGRTDLALKFDSSGKLQTFEPPQATPLDKTMWRVRRTARSDGLEAPRLVQTLEDAPFYSRSVIAGSLMGEPVTMMHESLSLDRFRMPIVQAMLPFRMPRALR
jgi:carotenoid 1,2-hydratase